MAIPGIPMTTNGADAFAKALDLKGLMQEIHQRNQLAEVKKQHEAEMALRRQSQGRLEQAAADAHRLAGFHISKAEREANPDKQVAYINQLLNSYRNARGQQSEMGNQGSVQPIQPMGMFQGGGMPSTEEIENPTVIPPSQEQVMHGFAGQQPQAPQQGQSPTQQRGLFDLPADELQFLQMAGVKVPTFKENPEYKRMEELKNKVQLEQFKHELKLEEKKTENEFKNEATRQKVIESAKNDIPHLESTLEALENMKKIATNNPDLFGHSGIYGFGSAGAGERFAKTTDNPNAGAWQTYGLSPIVAAEGKMSSKGNQLALRAALANKPNFEETQPVALSKINANIEQTKDQIKLNKKIAGIETKTVTVIDPNGKKFKTTKANSKHLPMGWKIG